MKQVKLMVFLLFVAFTAQAQISSYGAYDNVESAVFSVEDMSSDEIKTYNSFIADGMSERVAVMAINAGRAHSNLEEAPATIIDYHMSQISENDSIPDAIGSVYVGVEIMNTTPKVIKEITLTFSFKNIYDDDVLDIKTGDKYYVVKYKNLKGRTKSNKYSEIIKTLFDCYHLLDYHDASYRKPFYNSKAKSVSLHSVKIRYNDGSTSTRAAVFYNGYDGKDLLLTSGPLSPFTTYSKATREN